MNRLHIMWLVLALCGLLVASCQPVGNSARTGVSGAESLRRDGAVARTREPGQNQIEQRLQTAEKSFGTLQLLIRWPDLPVSPPYRAQLIPTSTNTLRVTVKTGTTTIAQQSVSRPSGESTSSVSMQLEAATNLSVVAEAFNATLGTTTPIAQGTAAGININKSLTTNASIVLASLLAPSITGFNLNSGKVGDTLTLTGTQFQQSWAEPSVTFNGTAATTLTNVSSISLQVVVPSGATVGTVVVKVDGVSSTSNAIFWVASALGISANQASWDTSTGASRRVLFAGTLNFTSQPTWALKTGETAEQWGTAPSPSWASSNGTAGSVAASGVFTAGGSFSSSNVTGSHGGLTSAAIAVSAVDVTSFAISPTSGTLGPDGEASLNFQGINTLSDSSTTSAASFLSSDAASVSVSASGVATVANSATYGTLTITATSTLKGSLSATANVEQSNYKVVTIAGSARGNVDATGTSARFNLPAQLAIDGTTLFIAEQGNDRVRKLDLITLGVTTPVPTNIAGVDNSTPYIQADYGVCLNASTLYTTLQYKVRKFDRGSTYASAAAGTATAGYQEGTADSQGNGILYENPYSCVAGDSEVYIADYGSHRIRKLVGNISTLVAGDGIAGTVNGTGSAARFNGPIGLAKDNQGVLYVSEQDGCTIRKIVTGTGAVTTYAGSGTPASTDGQGTAAAFNKPSGLALNATGSLFVAENIGNRIRKINSKGYVSTVAGSGTGATTDGIGTAAAFLNPAGIALGSDGLIYVSETGGDKIRKLTRVP